MSDFFSRKRVLQLAALALLIVALLAGFVLSRTVFLTRSLNATPKTTAIPFFEPTTAVLGWEQSSDTTSASGNAVNYHRYQNTKGTCTFTTATYMDAIYYQKRSDAWLSKDVLYGSASQDGTLVKQESTGALSVSQGGSLEFAVANWDAKTVDRKTSRTVWLAARAVDTPYKLPKSTLASNPSDNGFGLDESLGIPVLIADYQCSKPAAASKAEFDKLLAATKIDLR